MGIGIYSKSYFKRSLSYFFQQKTRCGSVFRLFDVSDLSYLYNIQYRILVILSKKTLKISILCVRLLIAELCTRLIFSQSYKFYI